MWDYIIDKLTFQGPANVSLMYLETDKTTSGDVYHSEIEEINYSQRDETFPERVHEVVDSLSKKYSISADITPWGDIKHTPYRGFCTALDYRTLGGYKVELNCDEGVVGVFMEEMLKNGLGVPEHSAKIDGADPTYNRRGSRAVDKALSDLSGKYELNKTLVKADTEFRGSGRVCSVYDVWKHNATYDLT